MIRCVSVHKAYSLGDRSVQALRGVDVEIPSSGFFAIMGRSGSGKSTLLHLLAALDRPDDGEIHIGGTRIDQMTEAEATTFRRERIGIVFQQFNLIPTLTARENVELPGLLAGKGRSDLGTRAMELLERLGIAERSHHRPDAMSGGEQQRVAIARALLFRPAVLLADEPTGALDSATSETLWALLAEVAAEQDTTVVMVTHEPAAAAHCERVYLVRDGRIEGTIETEGLDAAGVASRYQECG